MHRKYGNMETNDKPLNTVCMMMILEEKMKWFLKDEKKRLGKVSQNTNKTRLTCSQLKSQLSGKFNKP